LASQFVEPGQVECGENHGTDMASVAEDRIAEIDGGLAGDAPDLILADGEVTGFEGAPKKGAVASVHRAGHREGAAEDAAIGVDDSQVGIRRMLREQIGEERVAGGAVTIANGGESRQGHEKPARVLDYVDFHGPDYPYVFGFYGREGEGWRWARTDVEALLKYGGETALQIDVFVPEPGAYHRHRSVSVDAWIGDCKLGSATPSGHAEVRFDLKGCAPPVGSSARVRLLSDDVVDTVDDRQLAMVVNGLGFVDGAAPGTGATP